MEMGLPGERTIYKNATVMTQMDAPFMDLVCSATHRALTGDNPACQTYDPNMDYTACTTEWPPAATPDLQQFCAPSCVDVSYAKCVLPGGDLAWAGSFVARMAADTSTPCIASADHPTVGVIPPSPLLPNSNTPYVLPPDLTSTYGTQPGDPPAPGAVVYRHDTRYVATNVLSACVNLGASPPNIWRDLQSGFRGAGTGALFTTPAYCPPGGAPINGVPQGWMTCPSGGNKIFPK
jgi:hypothetical protein